VRRLMSILSRFCCQETYWSLPPPAIPFDQPWITGS
jgi:hypothetical protein